MKSYQLKSSTKSRLTRAFGAVALGTALLGTAACTSLDTVNSNLVSYESANDGLSQIRALGSLKEGTHKDQVLALLGNPEQRALDELVRSSKDMGDIKAAFYGQVEVMGTPAEIEQYRLKMQDLEVWTVPFKHVEKRWSLGTTTFDTEFNGVQGKVVFIFGKDGKLVTDAKPTVSPASGVNEKAIFPEMIEGIIKTAPGVGIGAMGL
jgi:hypothetical protein